jgi:type VI secretion system secreted protein Hcp
MKEDFGMKTVAIRPRYGKGLIAGLLVMLTAAVGSAAYYMKIQGVGGSSKAPERTGWIEIMSLSWGSSNPGAAIQTKMTGGRCRVSPLRVVKRVDKASPGLHKSFSEKRRIPFLELDLGSERHRLEDVLIISVKPAGTAKGGDNLPLEQLSFNYAKCSYHYVEQKKTVKPKTTPPYPLDVKLER